MPKPKWGRKDVFDEEESVPETLPQRDVAPGTVPYIPTSALNRVYETGAAGFPDIDFVSPEEKRIEELEGILSQLKGQGGLVGQDGSLMVQGFQLSPTGLIAPESVSFESWEQVGHLLFRLEGSIQWLIGDWLLYGEQVQWGDTGAIAQALGREAQTLYHYKSICQTFEFCRRRQNLSFGHHEAVRALSIEEQDQALEQAELRRLSVAALRKWLRGDSPAPALPAGDVPTFKALSGDLDKFMRRDPSKAKPQEREQLRAVTDELWREIGELRRKWGIK